MFCDFQLFICYQVIQEGTREVRGEDLDGKWKRSLDLKM